MYKKSIKVGKNEMVTDGYLIIRFKEVGIGILSVKINNLYERLLFKKRDNADAFMDKLPDTKGLCVYHISEAYANNKMIYEDNRNMLNCIDINEFAVV